MKRLLIIIFIIIAILLPIRLSAAPLTDALIKYEQIAENDGWNKVNSDKKIQKGDYGVAVISLWSRLFISGDAQEDFNGCFDNALETTVKRFQDRHGLKTDGIVGRQTLVELNIPVEERIKQIKSNINSVPDLKEGTYFLINIPDFKLYIVENKRIISSLKVIVGKKKKPTPLFAQKIKYIELNPYWNIPHKIAVKEILPIVKKNPMYLKKENIKVFENWSDGAKELDSDFIDWSKITKYNFHYKFRQEPGKNNALGNVKFIFPNKFSVYLHDTNKPYLFNEEIRAFSHGCIRVDNPMMLALYILMNDPKSDLGLVIDFIASGKRKIIKLSKPIDIYIVYWTAWVDNGVINFRNDIYDKGNEKIRFTWNKTQRRQK